MEQARIHWWRQAVGGSAWDWTKVGVLVAHHTIDYLSLFDSGTRWRCLALQGDVGTKSMDVHYTMACEGRPVAKAKTVLVCFDHREKRTTSVPQAWRDALERLKAPSATKDPNLM